MDASAWIAVVAALIAGAGALTAVSQAQSARRQTGFAERQTELQEQMHRDAAQPYVWADFRLHPQEGVLLMLVIENSGPTVATDVTIAFDPPLASETEKVGPQGVLASLPPGRRLMWTFDSGLTVFDSKLPLEYKVTITGRGPFGPLPVLSYTLDLNDFYNTSAKAEGTVYGLQKSLEKSLQAIGKAIGK